MMIRAVLGNPNHPEYGVATIPFPIPRDQYAHCVDLTESGSCSECVLQVQFDVGVGAGQRCGHPTLGPSGCGHIQGSLGQDRSIEAVHRVGAYGSGQACNP